MAPFNDKEFIHQVYLSANNMQNDYQLDGYPEWPNVEEYEENGGFLALNKYFERLSDLCGYQVKPSASSLLRIAMKYADVDQASTADSILLQVLGHYEVEPGLINRQGYSALEQGFCPVAIKLFEYNLEKYPKSPNAWDSLGEGLLSCGDTEKAKECFERAISLATKVNHPDLKVYEQHLRDVLAKA